jgi:hypothetical protein
VEQPGVAVGMLLVVVGKTISTRLAIASNFLPVVAERLIVVVKSTKDKQSVFFMDFF